MYKLENLNDINLTLMDDLNIPVKHKMELIELYKNKNIIKKLFFRKDVRFLKIKNQYIGFLWFTKLDKNIYKINWIKLMSQYATKEYYSLLFSSFNYNSKFIMNSLENLSNIEELSSIGILPNKIIYEMKMNIWNKYDIDFNDLNFHVFKPGEDEKKRCFIQNIAFTASGRNEIKEEDIIYEQYQKYYIPQGSIFVTYNNDTIGYGQIVKQDNKLYAVNLCILPNYRGRGVGKELLIYLINTAYELGYNEIYLKCEALNNVAYNLYQSMNFSVINNYYEFHMENIKA